MYHILKAIFELLNKDISDYTFVLNELKVKVNLFLTMTFCDRFSYTVTRLKINNVKRDVKVY